PKVKASESERIPGYVNKSHVPPKSARFSNTTKRWLVFCRFLVARCFKRLGLFCPNSPLCFCCCNRHAIPIPAIPAPIISTSQSTGVFEVDDDDLGLERCLSVCLAVLISSIIRSLFCMIYLKKLFKMS